MLTFDQPGGGTVERQLAVPFIAGMDGIEVAQARLRLAAEPYPFVVEDYQKTKAGDRNVGIVLNFGREVRLSRVTLSYPSFPTAVQELPTAYTLFGGTVASNDTGTPDPLHAVVRVGRPDGGFGPPAFADPPFGLDSPLYDPVLAGATLTDLGKKRMQLTVPKLRTTSVLIQLASGGSPDALKPVNFDAEVTAVEIDAAAERLTVTLQTGQGPVPLFEHGPALLPEAGPQLVQFVPLATRELNDRLASNGDDALTLPLALSVASAAPGRIGLLEATLQARYRLDPLGEPAANILLDGGWRTLAPEAAAERQAADSRMTLQARLEGRALNAGTPRPGLRPGGTGVRITTGLRASAPARFVVPEGAEGRPLVALRLRLGVPEAAEVSLMLHADAGGLPGSAIAAPMVRQLAPGPLGWVEFPLTGACILPVGTTWLWVVARTTVGAAFWCAAPVPATGEDQALDAGDERTARISRDEGATWRAPEQPLGAFGGLEVQLVEEVPDPQPAPSVVVQSGTIENVLDPVGGWQRLGDREFEVRDVPVPAALRALLANRPGSGRVSVPVNAFSRSLMTLVVEEMVLFYDPTAAPGGGA